MSSEDGRSQEEYLLSHVKPIRKKKKSVDEINLDEFTPHRLLYWTDMKTNSLEIRKFIAKYYRRKYPDSSFWIKLLKREGLL